MREQTLTAIRDPFIRLRHKADGYGRASRQGCANRRVDSCLRRNDNVRGIFLLPPENRFFLFYEGLARVFEVFTIGAIGDDLAHFAGIPDIFITQ